jgi:hypothetical protein
LLLPRPEDIEARGSRVGAGDPISSSMSAALFGITMLITTVRDTAGVGGAFRVSALDLTNLPGTQQS